MDPQGKKFRIAPGCKFVDRVTGISYIVRSADTKMVMYRSADGQGEVSSCACNATHFEAKLKNRTFEILQ